MTPTVDLADVVHRYGSTTALDRVTLRLENGRFTGISGCNSFTAPVRETGETPGSLEVGPAAGTMMACPDPAGEIERRFLHQLEGVERFGFMIGDLMLSYATEEGRGLMLFERPEPFPAGGAAGPDALHQRDRATDGSEAIRRPRASRTRVAP